MLADLTCGGLSKVQPPPTVADRVEPAFFRGNVATLAEEEEDDVTGKEPYTRPGSRIRSRCRWWWWCGKVDPV